MSASRSPYTGLPVETLHLLLQQKRREIDTLLAALSGTVTSHSATATSHPTRDMECHDAPCSAGAESVVDMVSEFRPLLLLPDHRVDAHSPPPPLSPFSSAPEAESCDENEEEQTVYSASEVAAMTDDVLLATVSRLFHISHLSCKHCRSTEVPLHKFVETIRNRCSKLWKGKSGLYPGMQLPKSCDNQSERNRRSNGVNNKFFSLIKKATTPEEVEALQLQRSVALYTATEGKVIPKRIAKQATAAGAGAGAGASTSTH
jgi:hypothetical protein